MEKRFIQLYSLKDEIAKDFEGVLRRVKDIGYTGVEFASGFYGNYSAADLKAFLSELGLEALSSHITTPEIPNQIDYAAKLGLKYLIDPMYSMNTYEEALEAAAKFNEAGKLCAQAGIQFGYHNHRFEFQQGKDGYLLETLLLNTDPGLVCFQLDVGWATCAGVDCPEFIKKYPGRFKLIHVKECNRIVGAEPSVENQAEWNVPNGKGLVDWANVRDAALASGTKEFIVEREYDYAGDIFKCVEEDCAHLKSL